MLMLGPAAATSTISRRGWRKAPKFDRHRLGIAEQKRCSHEQKHGRHYDGAEQIDVLQRIQAHPPKPPSRVITQLVRHEAVRAFVQRDGNQNRENPGRCDIDLVR
jgi:hypothetical protein